MTASANKPTARGRRGVSDRNRSTFLAALTAGHSVTHAAALAGRGRQSFYELAKRDAEFQAAWRDAWEAGTDALEDEARRRAVDGWEEPQFRGGQQVGVVRKYSDRLLELMLRGRRPTMYSANRLEVTGPGGLPLIEDKAWHVDMAAVAKILKEAGVTLAADVIDGEATEIPAALPERTPDA